ncbi:spore gernimation protein GerA [Paenibacillus crassostreae]|uniref:Spore gernimation protein GerA n=1 Tax=Paenibacillus crassostreae TaxID=1763538 RepID=A0A162L786_9BACL|nr:spore germination protein [Paenibacillus crassostreae]OAB72075.1 spore gernimation protein GerA [Paenibacillus crassostreae]
MQNKKQDTSAPSTPKLDDSSAKPSLSHILSEFQDCIDLTHRNYPDIGIDLIYFSHQVDQDKLYREVMHPLLTVQSFEDIPTLLEQSQYSLVTDAKELIIGILSGRVATFFRQDAYLVDVFGLKSRTVQPSETETVITGPHDAFTEQAGINLSLIRQRIKSSHLKVIQLSVGEVTKTNIYLLYIKDIANMDFVNEAITRISNIEVDSVFDTNMLLQFIDDDPYSVFPQFLTSERPEAMASKLVGGRIVGIVDGSPSAFSAPTSFVEYFASSDDYNQRWLLGSASRLLRFVALIITLLFTALYVSVTTYHYEMIPENLLMTLVESRSKVPFPPIFEALFMEVTIELLREAGARLPSKIGQTIGIVGGIVIGQASVQAGLTSNILIIAVASSAIASFVTPAYVMSASIRLLRFGLILLAGIWGNFGIAIGLSAIVIHLSGLTSLNSSYLTPIAPFKPGDWKDLFIIAPFRFLKKRPTQGKPLNKVKNKIRK